MNRDVSMAQLATLRDWADQWEREARVTDAGGEREVAYLLRRAARKICLAAGLPIEPAEAAIPEIETALAELRAG